MFTLVSVDYSNTTERFKCNSYGVIQDIKRQIYLVVFKKLFHFLISLAHNVVLLHSWDTY